MKALRTALWIAGKGLRQHALSSAVAALSVGLATGLLMAVWVLKDAAGRTFASADGGFDAVLGARGSELQLVLNAVFHLEASPGNIKEADFLAIAADPAVARAVPIAAGDNYRGFRVVGTVPDLLAEHAYAEGKRFEFAAGRVFDPAAHEAVAGSFVAERLGFETGSTFQPAHGLEGRGGGGGGEDHEDDGHHHEETYTVVGVLEPSNTPADRVIWIPLEGVQTMEGHDPRAADEISAVLVKLKSAGAGFMLAQKFNRGGERLTFAWPIGRIVAAFFGRFIWFERVLGLVAYLVALTAAGTLFAVLHLAMNQRRREIAVLRALGARRWVVTAAALAEAAAISAAGALLGFVFFAGAAASAAAQVRAHTGVVIDWATPHPVWAGAALGALLLGTAAGLLPALAAYRTDVAGHLSPPA